MTPTATTAAPKEQRPARTGLLARTRAQRGLGKAMVKGVSGFDDVKGVKKSGDRITRARNYPGPDYGLMPKTKKDAARDFDGLVRIGVAAFCVIVGTSVGCMLAF